MPQAGFNPPGEKWQLCLNIVVTLPPQPPRLDKFNSFWHFLWIKWFLLFLHFHSITLFFRFFFVFFLLLFGSAQRIIIWRTIYPFIDSPEAFHSIFFFLCSELLNVVHLLRVFILDKIFTSLVSKTNSVTLNNTF